jgi:hypothetical protein
LKSIVADFEAGDGIVVADAAQVTETLTVTEAPGARTSFTATPLIEYVISAGAAALIVARSVIVLSFALIVRIL